MSRHLFGHMAYEGHRHTGCYGFGGRLTRRMFMVGGAQPALLVDRNVWAQLAERYAAEHPHLWDPTPGTIPGLFGTPVHILHPVDGERQRS